MLEFAVIVESEHTWYNKQRNIFYLYSRTGVIFHSWCYSSYMCTCFQKILTSCHIYSIQTFFWTAKRV